MVPSLGLRLSILSRFLKIYLVTKSLYNGMYEEALSCFRSSIHFALCCKIKRKDKSSGERIGTENSRILTTCLPKNASSHDFRVGNRDVVNVRAHQSS